MTNKYPSYGPVATLNQKNYTPVANCKSLQSVCFALLHRISSVSAVIEIFFFCFAAFAVIVFVAFRRFIRGRAMIPQVGAKRNIPICCCFTGFASCVLCFFVFLLCMFFCARGWGGDGMGMDDTRIRGETETWKLGGGNSCMEMVGMSRDKADGRRQDSLSLSPLYKGAHRVRWCLVAM